MSLLNLLKEKVHPRTVISGNKRQESYFGSVNRDLQRYENIYRSGGLISQAIDAYPLFGLSAGYELDGPTEEVKTISKWFHKIDIDYLLWQAWVDSLTYGDSIAENVISRGKDVLYCVPRNPKFFTIDFDDYGIVQSYTQRVNNKVTKLDPPQVTSVTLLSLSGEAYGSSLIGRAIDEIMRDTRTAESTAVAIERHGFPRFHIKCGSDDNEYSDPAKEDIAKEFEELKADNEFVSNWDLEIVPIDTQGVNKISDYNEWSMSRVLGALGVPSQVIGTGENTTTYATASVEMKSFMLRTETQQKKVARRFNDLIDLKLKSEGKVKLTFNKINESPEAVI